jgi:glycosyltransferase involved in cell wall biosynthesis
MNNLAVIIPFFNEEVYLEDSVKRVLKFDIFNQIILVDDCSTDNSPSIAKAICSSNDNVMYLKTPYKGGKGNALITAKTSLTTSHVVIHDADLEYFPEDIVEMYKHTMSNENTLILGSRFIGNKERINLYSRTLFANKIMSAFFSLVNFYKVTDVATCYKLMPVSFLKQTDIKEQGFSIEVEILSKFLKYNKSIKEVPIKYSGRSYEEGKKIKTSDGFFYLFNTIKYRFFK